MGQKFQCPECDYQATQKDQGIPRLTKFNNNGVPILLQICIEFSIYSMNILRLFLNRLPVKLKKCQSSVIFQKKCIYSMKN